MICPSLLDVRVATEVACRPRIDRNVEAVWFGPFPQLDEQTSLLLGLIEPASLCSDTGQRRHGEHPPASAAYRSDLIGASIGETHLDPPSPIGKWTYLRMVPSQRDNATAVA
jgi:hypothetical protein